MSFESVSCFPQYCNTSIKLNNLIPTNGNYKNSLMKTVLSSFTWLTNQLIVFVPGLTFVFSYFGRNNVFRQGNKKLTKQIIIKVTLF